MSDYKFDKGFDDMKVDQKYKDEEMFSQLAQKEQDLESAIDMVEKEIKRKNERIIELELMLEEKEDWFNLKSHMVKKLEGELNPVHARHSVCITDEEAIDVTINEKERAEEEKTVLSSEQTGSSYDGEDGTDKVGYEKKVNTCFDIIFEKPKKNTFKPKLFSEKRKIVNLIPKVTDQIMIKSNENKDDIELEKHKNVSFDIMFEKTKKRMSKPKLSSEKRKPINLIPNVTAQNIKSNKNKEDVKYEEKKNNSFENKEDVRYEEKKNNSFENKEDVRYEEKKNNSFENKEDVRYEEKKNISFENKEDVSYEEKENTSFENKDDVRYEEKKNTSFENKKDVRYDEKKNISFDIVFDSHKKKRTKPKLTSGGRKAQFQLKNIDENKAKSRDNEQKEDAPTADIQIAVKNRDSAYKEEQAVKKNVCFDVFFESPKKLKPKPKLSFINRKQENEAKNSFDENDVQEEQKPEKSQKVPSQTTEVNLSIRGKLGQFENDVLIKRKDKNEIRFRFSFFHGNTAIPSRIPVMVRTRLNNRPLINSARRIPVRVLRITQTKNATITGPQAVRSFPKSKISVKRGTDININSTQIAKSPNGDDRRLSRRKERCTKLPRNRNFISPNPVSIGEKCKSPCPGLTSESLHLPSKTTQNAMVKSRHSVSASGLTRLTQIKGRKKSVDEYNTLSNSAITILPPIVKRNDTYINRPLSASGFAKIPPINSTNKTMKMDRPMSARLSPLLNTFENTEKRPLSACGSPKLPPTIDVNPLQISRPTSSLSGYSLLPPISSYKRGSAEDEKVPVEDSNRSREIDLSPKRAE